MRVVLRYGGEIRESIAWSLMLAFSSAAAVLLAASCMDRGLETRVTTWPDGSPMEQWTERRRDDGSFMREGPYSSWYASGRIHEEGQFRGDRKTGIWRSWYDLEPATRISEGAYVEGEKDGAWEYRMTPHHAHMASGLGDHAGHPGHGTESGSGGEPPPVKREFYRLGVPEGTWVSWYPGGQIADSVAYRDGQLNGRAVSYYPGGQPAALAIYDRGVRKSGITMWDETGKRLQSTP